MANEFVKVTDQNGVDHPVKDLAAFPRSEQAEFGAYQLLPIPYKTAPTTQNGVVYTYDSDGVITLSTPNGSATAQTDIVLFGVYGSTSEILKKGDGHYYMSTGNTVNGVQTRVAYGSTLLGDGADGYTFEAPNGISFVLLRIASGTVITTPLTLKPMLTTGTIRVPFAPFAMTNKQLTDNIFKDVPISVTAPSRVLDMQTGSFDLNNVPLGVSFTSNSNATNISHKPSEVTASFTVYTLEQFEGFRYQIMILRDNPSAVFRRSRNNSNTWESWYKFTGTSVV